MLALPEAAKLLFCSDSFSSSGWPEPLLHADVNTAVPP
jgi:hypothetical protein